MPKLLPMHEPTTFGGDQTKWITHNIAENERNIQSYNICCPNIFDREQT